MTPECEDTDASTRVRCRALLYLIGLNNKDAGIGCIVSGEHSRRPWEGVGSRPDGRPTDDRSLPESTQH